MVESKQIQELLCGLPKLKTLLGACSHNVPPDPWLEASDIVASEWACTDLEVFDCEIKVLRRPAKPANGRASGPIKTKAEQNSIDLQRRVCAQLGKLTNLKRLILRGPAPTFESERIPNNPRNTHDCLVLGLETRLDLLVDLKNLRMVRQENMDVDIGNFAEQAWVAYNWPILRFDTQETQRQVHTLSLSHHPIRIWNRRTMTTLTTTVIMRSLGMMSRITMPMMVLMKDTIGVLAAILTTIQTMGLSQN